MNQRSVQQRPWTDNGSPKSKIRFPVGSNSERSRLSTRARFLVKVTKTPIRPTNVTVNGIPESSEHVPELLPSMPPIVVRMKAKTMKGPKQPPRNSIPMLQLAIGTSKPNSMTRAFLTGSSLTLESPRGLTGAAAERIRLQLLAEEEAARLAEEEAARKRREKWVSVRDYDAADATAMSCKRGDVFHTVGPAERDGWVTCIKKRTGETGELPAAYLAKMSGRKYWKLAQDRIVALIRKEQALEQIQLEKWLDVVRELKQKHKDDSERVEQRERRARAAAQAARAAQADDEADRLAAERALLLRAEADAAARLQSERDKQIMQNAQADTDERFPDFDERKDAKAKRKAKFRALPPVEKSVLPLPTATSSKSSVMEYASETMGAGRSQFYKFIWCNKLKHHIDAHITKEELGEALRVVNADLITETQIMYCLLALDTVSKAANNAPFDFRMFCVVAALSERVHAVEGMMDGAMGALDFRDENALQLKILKARKLFYLSDGAMETGCMTFEELEHVCLAGHIDMEMAEQLVDMVEDSGGHEVQFLDFLSYLPLFIQASSNIQSNPLAFKKQTRLSRAAGGGKGKWTNTFKDMVKKQQNISGMSLVNQIGPKIDF